VGNHAVVVVIDSARSTLWAVDSLGAPPRQLTSEGFENLPNGTGFWSPDGSQLVFESTRTGAPDLWVLDFASGETRQLTSDLRADRHPSWSPDGQWILFESERGRQTDLWVVPAAGGDAVRLTNDAAIEVVVGWRGQTHQVAYTIEGGTGSLLSVPVAGGDERALSPDSVTVDYFTLSPDGSQVAFTSRRTGSVLDIWVMPTGGGPARLLVSPQATNPRVFWSPDGTKLAFLGIGGGTPDPWVLDVATGALQQVVTWNSIEYDLIWGRSSDELLVLSDRESRFSDVWRVPLDDTAAVRLTSEGLVNLLQTTLDGGTRILVGVLGGETGRLGLGEVRPDGTIRIINDARSVWGVAWGTPAGSDSVAVVIEGDGGELTSAMMSLADGGSRPLGPPGASVNYWSGNGTMIAFAGEADQGRAVGVVDLRTGMSRTLSLGAGQNGGAEFLPGDSVVVFRRNRPESRIAVLDLADLLSRTP
jgi:Tol biopolymer transport system component